MTTDQNENRPTPGPWKVFTNFGAFSIGGCHDGRDDYPVAELWRTGLKNHDANARLIAAAPEMFELLETLHNSPGIIPAFVWRRVDEIIKRVKGNQ